MHTRSIWTYSLCLIAYFCLYCVGADEEEADDCTINASQSNSASFIASVVCIYVICLTCAGILVMYLYQFAQNRDDPNIENRHPRLVYLTVSMVIFANLILFPLAIDYWTLECVTHTAWIRQNGEANKYMEGFLFVSFVVILLAWLNLVVLRVWLLRFDYGASLAAKHQIWKKGLGIDGGASTWWINNQQTWGKESYLLKVVAIPYILSVVSSVLVSPILWIVAIILCCFVIVNVYKVREIHDNFHIRDEVMLFAKSSIVIAVILVVAYIISVSISQVSIYIVLIWSILVMLLLTIASYIQTGWVLYGIRRKNEKSEKLVKSINDEWESNISLLTVLRDKGGFEVFMDFLVAEYSTENLLCYVEATQFLRKWKWVIFRMKCLIVQHNEQQQQEQNGSIPANSPSVDATTPFQALNLKTQQNASELVSTATDYVQKKMESNEDDDAMLDEQPWAFHDKESVLIRFEWIKLPPVMKKENITLWDHFRHLRSKYISATSAHQVNIRSALYRHYKAIKREDCQLSQLDISDVFNDPLAQSPDDDHELLSINEEVTVTGTPHIPAPLSPQISTQQADHSDMSDIEEEESSFQPGQQTKDSRKKPTVAGQANTGQMEMSKSNTNTNTNRNSKMIKRSQTSQYNRALRNLYGVAKVLQLIEDTRKELWKNMNDSFVRFRSTESYVNYIKKLYLEGNKQAAENEQMQSPAEEQLSLDNANSL